jgi:hypothetical protein
MACRPIVKKYIRFLLGEISLSLSGTAEEKEQDALEILRFAVTDLLQMDPVKASKLLSLEDLELLGVKPLLKHIMRPSGIDPDRDIRYFVHRAFPLQVPYDKGNQILVKYRRIMDSGKKDVRQRFSRGAFSGQSGVRDLSTLVLMLISNNIEYRDIADLYRIFSDTARMNTVFKTKWRIYDAVKVNYSTPLECLHHSLPAEHQDDFLYRFYQFCEVYRAFIS